MLERMRRLLFFPDDQIGWLPFAVLAAIRAHRHRPADAILSSSSPVTAHLVAGVVAQALHVAWVAEFRDPWIGNALAHPAPWFHRVLGHRLEHWIVSTADRSVFVTPSLTELYRRRYPALASRFSTVTNGYDLDRRGQPAPWRSRSPVSLQRPTMALVYAGTLDRPAELRTFLDGLQLYDRRRGSRPRVQVEFIGHVSDACERILRTSASRLGPNVVTSTEFVPRDTVRERLRTADGALVMLGDGPGMGLFVGGKLYAYLGEDCPIVAMLPHGDARNLLESLGWGIVAMPEPESVAEALERFVSEHNHRVIADPERRFERSRLVAQLASVLDSAAAEND